MKSLILVLFLALPVHAQVPKIVKYIDYNNKLYLTVTTPYKEYTGWFAVWAESNNSIIAVFTNNNWSGGLERCEYNRGTWVFEVLCGHGEEKELKLIKGEVTCKEFQAMGTFTIKYARFIGWASAYNTITYNANIAEIGTLYEINNNGCN
jgi:hypothetical protein